MFNNLLKSPIYRGANQHHEFYKKIIYSDATFNCKVDFSYTRFDTTAVFNKSDFISDAWFIMTQFDDLALFEESRFRTSVYFSGSSFEHAAFPLSTFDTVANFSTCTFNHSPNFEYSKFGYILDLSYLNLKGDAEIDLTSAMSLNTPPCLIDIEGTDLSKVKFRYNEFRLYKKKDPLVREIIYRGLLARYLELNFVEDYEILDKEYKEWKFKNENRHFINFIQKIWWDYGYDKERIILITLLIYAMLSIINFFFIQTLIKDVYRIPFAFKRFKKIKKYKGMQMFINLIPIVFVYTALIFFGVLFKLDYVIKSKALGAKFGYLVYFFIMYLSGLICLAYLANYIITV